MGTALYVGDILRIGAPMKPRIALATLVVLLLGTSCSSASAGDVLQSKVARHAPDATTAAPLSDALDRFGGEMFTTVVDTAELQNANAAISPFSIAAALLMTRAGSSGQTRAELDQVLHLARIDPDAGFNTIDQALATRSLSTKRADGTPVKVTLSTANSLWGQKGYPIETGFLDVLAADYGAGLRVVDYASNSEGARRAINRWVADRTNNKIAELIPTGVLDSTTRLVLTNALHLNAAWAEPFDTNDTSDATFTRLDGSTTTARLMRQTETFGYAAGDGWQAVEVPYAGNKLAMDVIIPEPGRFAAVEAQLNAGIGPFVTTMGPASLSFGLPRFSFRTQAQLVDALRAMGVETLFDPDRADLSAITTADKLYVSDVLHEAYVAVTESGTEAAAATAVVTKASAAPATPRTVFADHPFLFAIRDRDTGAVLMIGRVLDPTAA
jgi:serpin B